MPFFCLLPNKTTNECFCVLFFHNILSQITRNLGANPSPQFSDFTNMYALYITMLLCLLLRFCLCVDRSNFNVYYNRYKHRYGLIFFLSFYVVLINGRWWWWHRWFIFPSTRKRRTRLRKVGIVPSDKKKIAYSFSHTYMAYAYIKLGGVPTLRPSTPLKARTHHPLQMNN